jgi:hypothetical protein
VNVGYQFFRKYPADSRHKNLLSNFSVIHIFLF